MEAVPKQIKLYQTSAGRKPFIQWLEALKDQRAKQKIQARLDRLSLGNLGQTNSLGAGVQELKIDFGPGFRVYFGCEDNSIVILLLGGDKSSQNEDIKKAKKYWKEYKAEKKYAKC